MSLDLYLFLKALENVRCLLNVLQLNKEQTETIMCWTKKEHADVSA